MVLLLPSDGAGAAGVVEPNSVFELAGPLVAPPNKPDAAAGALVVGGVAEGVVDTWLLKLNNDVFDAAGVVEGAAGDGVAPPNRPEPPAVGAVLPPPKRPDDGGLVTAVCPLEDGALFSPVFCPNKLPPPAVEAPPPNRFPPPPDVAVLPKENVVDLLVLFWFVLLPKRPPLGVLPVEALSGVEPNVEGFWLLPPNSVEDF